MGKMDDSTGQPDIAESVEEMKTKLEAMKRIIDMNEAELRNRRVSSRYRGSFINGKVLSLVFALVLIIILFVTTYAFVNLYRAIKKKYTGQHSEL